MKRLFAAIAAMMLVPTMASADNDMISVSELRKQVERMGGKFMKFTSPGNDGVPDRIAILPGGRVWFVELKREGEKPTAVQKWQLEQLRKMGCNVALITGKQEARAWIREVIG